MIIAPLITKQQIARYVNIKENIKDSDINPCISDVMRYDIEPVLPNALLQAIEAVIMAKPQQWNKNKTYAVNDVVNVGSSGVGYVWYKALSVSTDSEPPNSNWGDLQIMNFHDEYLLPMMAQMFYYRFAADHGINIVQYGMVQNVDSTFAQVSDAQRGAFLGRIKSKVNAEILRVSNRISDLNYTLDGVDYGTNVCEDTKLKPKVKIYALGKNHLTDKCCDKEWLRDYPY